MVNSCIVFVTGLDFSCCGSVIIQLLKKIHPEDFTKQLYTLQPMKLITYNNTNLSSQLEFMESSAGSFKKTKMAAEHFP